MAKQYLVDSCEFRIDRSKGFIQEDVGRGRSITKAVGNLGFCDVVNGNKRLYTRGVWETNLKDGSQLMQRFSNTRAFGLLEHPSDGLVDLRSPISHIVTSAKLNEDGSLSGELIFLDTPEGQRMQSYIAVGYNPTVSSRGYGSLVKNADGVDVVQEDYVCEGWDVVMTPSFEKAEVRSVGESIKRISKPVIENRVTETLEGVSTPVIVPKPKNKNTMDANQIRQSLQLFVNLEAGQLTPTKYAEGMRQMEAFHQLAEAWAVEDPAANRRWDATRLHEEISAVQAKWTAAIAAPTGQVERLNKEKQVLLSVTEKIVKTGVVLKTKLKESLGVNETLMKVNQKNLARGRAWKKFAEGLQSKGTTLDEKYDIATTALEKLAKLYRGLRTESAQNVVRLGRRVLQLEFSDRVKSDPQFAAKLKEAKTPEALAELRESITPAAKPPGKKVVASTNESTPPEGKPKPVNESVTPPAKAKSGGTPASKEGQLGTLVVPIGNPKSVTESIAIARRLSTSMTGSIQ